MVGQAALEGKADSGMAETRFRDKRLPRDSPDRVVARKAGARVEDSAADAGEPGDAGAVLRAGRREWPRSGARSA